MPVGGTGERERWRVREAGKLFGGSGRGFLLYPLIAFDSFVLGPLVAGNDAFLDFVAYFPGLDGGVVGGFAGGRGGDLPALGIVGDDAAGSAGAACGKQKSGQSEGKDVFYDVSLRLGMRGAFRLRYAERPSENFFIAVVPAGA